MSHRASRPWVMHGGALLGATLLILATTIIAAKSSAGPAPSSSASAAPPPPKDPVPLASIVFPSEKSPTPKLEEWSSAPLVLLSENSEKSRCHARVVREWLKIHCDGPTGMIRELAGSPSDVVFWIAPLEVGSSLSKAAEIVVAVRKGDRRLIQFYGLTEGYEGPAWPNVAGFVEEHWDEGDDHPTVVLR